MNNFNVDVYNYLVAVRDEQEFTTSLIGDIFLDMDNVVATKTRDCDENDHKDKLSNAYKDNAFYSRTYNKDC